MGDQAFVRDLDDEVYGDVSPGTFANENHRCGRVARIQPQRQLQTSGALLVRTWAYRRWLRAPQQLWPRVSSREIRTSDDPLTRWLDKPSPIYGDGMQPA